MRARHWPIGLRIGSSGCSTTHRSDRAHAVAAADGFTTTRHPGGSWTSLKATGDLVRHLVPIRDFADPSASRLAGLRLPLRLVVPRVAKPDRRAYHRGRPHAYAISPARVAFMIRRTLPLLLLLTACGIGPQTREQGVTTTSPQIIHARRDVVWSAALTVLADRSLAIQSSDQTSGVISTVELGIPQSDWKNAGASQKGALNTMRPQRVRYTITIAGDSTASTVRVSTRLTWQNMYGGTIGECASSGYLERQLAAAIVASATP